jgi:MFS family permease
MFVSGLTYGAFFGMGAVYAADIGLSVKDISLFMGALVLGGFLFQYPLGWLSDTFGPIKVIFFSCIAGATIAFGAMFNPLEGVLLFFKVAVIGGFAMPLYSLCSVHTNNYLTTTQMVAASGTLVLLNATGATVGAPLTALAMDIFGPQAFYASLGCMLTTMGLFALYRFSQHPEIESEEQGEFVVMVASPMTASLNPDVELADIEAAAGEDADDILSSFEDLVSDLKEAEEAEETTKQQTES